MKRYLLFSGEDYYPIGGWKDFIGDFDSAEEAKSSLPVPGKMVCPDWFHIVDTYTKTIVAIGELKQDGPIAVGWVTIHHHAGGATYLSGGGS